MHILLIEDNPGDARIIYELIMEGNDSEVVLETCGSLREGLRMIAADPPDVVLLDLSLPDSHGLGTIQKLRDHYSTIPIVVLTGLDDETVGVQAVQYGAQDYLVKGTVESVLLRRAMRYAIERFRAEQALRRSQEEYRSLIDDVFNITNVGVAILDSNFKIVWVNDALLTFFGLTRDELIGHDKRVMVKEKLKCVFQDPDSFENNILTAYDAHDFTSHFECLVMPDDGHRALRWLEYWSQPISAGIYAEGRIENYADITARKQAELAEHDQRVLAEALRDAAAILTSTLNFEEVLDRILENLERVVVYNRAEVVLLEDTNVYVARYYGLGSHEYDPDQPVPIKELPFLAQMEATHSYLLSNNIAQEQYWADYPDLNTFGSYLGTPISFQNQVVGFINIYSVHFNQYNAVDADRLHTFSEHAAISIHNARIHRETRHYAALQERQRLARDLHDSVSQTLFTSSVMAETALKQWDRDAFKVKGLLEDVHKLTKSALAEMRVLLLELRPKALDQMTLRNLVELLAQVMRGRNALPVDLDIGELQPLPSDVKIGLYRIVQEALNNVAKHSTATLVNIVMAEQNGEVSVNIIDNGQGFNHDDVAASSLGLGIMAERAEAIGAELRIDSVVGKGTQVHVWWRNTRGEM
jgi:PAS domain S-box-containing protein